MSEQRLNNANVPAALEQMSRKAVAKRMLRDRLAQPRGFGGSQRLCALTQSRLPQSNSRHRHQKGAACSMRVRYVALNSW